MLEVLKNLRWSVLTCRESTKLEIQSRLEERILNQTWLEEKVENKSYMFDMPGK